MVPKEQAPAPPGQLLQEGRDLTVLRLLLGRRRHAVGGAAAAQVAAAVLRGLKSIREQRPDSKVIYVILDNLPLHKTPKIRKWCAESKVELCFTPTSTSWANPIECHFGPLREFVLANSYPRSHRQLSRALHKHCCWRNENARDPALLEAERRERARVRSEAGRRWGERQPRAA